MLVKTTPSTPQPQPDCRPQEPCTPRPAFRFGTSRLRPSAFDLRPSASTRLHPPRAADGHRHHGHPGRHRPAHAPRASSPTPRWPPPGSCSMPWAAPASLPSASAPPSIWSSCPPTSGPTRPTHMPPGLAATRPMPRACSTSNSSAMPMSRLRSVGDQPGVHYPQLFVLVADFAAGRLYLLAEIHSLQSCQPGAGPEDRHQQRSRLPGFRLQLHHRVPFPSETTPPASAARPYIALPYIAFDGTGQLVPGTASWSYQ